MAEYIERNTALEIIDRYAKTVTGENGTAIVEAVRDIVDIICPAADVAPVRHGHWINKNFYTRCSVCGKMAIYDKYGQEVESDYCPNCGARMDGDTDANGNDNKTPET